LAYDRTVRGQVVISAKCEWEIYPETGQRLGGLNSRPAHIRQLVDREGDYNRRTEAHNGNRRGERLVRVSGLPPVIVARE
jgi:hypothetical protein